MCFKNLPVEFDERGQPFLRGGVADPYSRVGRARRSPAPVDRRNRSRSWSAATATSSRWTSIRSRASRARWPSTPLPTSRRGGCSRRARWRRSSAATRSSWSAAIRATRSSSPAAPAASAAASTRRARRWPSRWRSAACRRRSASLIRNLALALEFLYDHPLHLHLLAGPGLLGRDGRADEPVALTRARRRAEAPHAETSTATGRSATLMDDLNPLSGKLYLEALHMTRVAREAYVLICGKYPHPQTIVPGGMSSTITLDRDERDVRPPGAVLRLQQEDRRRSGTIYRVLLRGQSRVQGGRPPPRAT